jgi:hypothetical protein
MRPNRELAKSLLEMSDAKEEAVRTASINETTVSAFVSLAYDSLREVLEAVCVLHGYKVTSHVCTGELMKTLVDGFDYTTFDRFRYIRNGINYYGKKIGLAQGKAIILKIFEMKKQTVSAMPHSK